VQQPDKRLFSRFKLAAFHAPRLVHDHTQENGHVLPANSTAARVGANAIHRAGQVLPLKHLRLGWVRDYAKSDHEFLHLEIGISDCGFG
jgi:hypothetical protein